MAAELKPANAAERIGAFWNQEASEFNLSFLGSDASITYPDYDVTIAGRPSPPHIAALLVYHLALSDGSQPTGSLISLAELPDASFYVTAFRGYTGAKIVRHFAAQPERLQGAVEQLKGASVSGLGDRAWTILTLPRVPVTLLWWDADEEFEARAELLFDTTASRHLTTDGCAVLGSWLATMLVSHG